MVITMQYHVQNVSAMREEIKSLEAKPSTGAMASATTKTTSARAMVTMVSLWIKGDGSLIASIIFLQWIAHGANGQHGGHAV